MRPKYTRSRRRPRRTYTNRRRTSNSTRRRSVDPITLGAQIGGLLGIVFVIYGLLGDRLPEAMAGLLSSGFAISIGVALLVVAISIYFSQEAGWFDRESGRTRRRTRTYRRRRS